MKKRLRLWLCLILGIMILTACQSNNEISAPAAATLSENNKADLAETVPETIDTDLENTVENEVEDELDESTVADEINTSENDGIINPLTGEYVEAGTLGRPIAVMLDNQYSARPQAGLIEADVAYEMLVEGLITRYMGIFYSSQPEHIGPVRSARPYYLQKALEYNPYYVHVGGSMQALSDIKTYKMADIDGLSSGAFHRESHKKIPHNMYTEASTLIKDANRRQYYEKVDIDFLDFNDAFLIPKDGTDANTIKFLYKAPTSSDKVGYFTTYVYDPETTLYMRHTNGKPHIDEDTGEQLYATNILVQYASQKVLDSEGRLQLGLVGEGKGMYYTGGKGIPVTWSKADSYATTYFKDADNNAIKLNPGKTWFQIMPKGKTETVSP
ncbi:DUF3048 domain-containing protein [Fusibacter paucivorans]|uniref:DUF3048 domain-containing protein n=1 Tax=Fusibacter paucivorans TaxID=76009 RepID=A0ABS5PPB4_9FIRM|nr:DUF3048 domain-containing protein [Fusibacter paucivorans]MBS7526767.1 DUF3048 domain-containing protein [Fusibacter paucivorans]